VAAAQLAAVDVLAARFQVAQKQRIESWTIVPASF
jgi:hypothetical protein